MKRLLSIILATSLAFKGSALALPAPTFDHLNIGGFLFGGNDWSKTPFDAPVPAVGDGVVDDTAAVQWVFARGGYLPPLPAGQFYKITKTLQPSPSAKVFGMEALSLIKLVLPPGSPAIPVIEDKSTSPGVELENFAVDGGYNPGGSTPALAAPTIYGGNIIAGSAIILGGDRSAARNLIVNNAWDNGISINAQDSATQPTLVDVGGISCSKNGYGSQGGACVDNASGYGSTVHDSEDYGSYTSFISDIGAGAHGTLNNLISRYAVSLGIYCGSADTNLSNLYIEFSGGTGLWLDAAQQNKTDDQGRFTSYSRVNLSNLYVYLPAKQGVLIKGGKYNISNARVTGAYFGTAGSATGHYAYEVNTQTSLFDIVCTNCSDDASNNVQYGWGETTSNGAVVSATLNGTQGFNGVSGGVMPGAGTGPMSYSGPVTASKLNLTSAAAETDLNLSNTASGGHNWVVVSGASGGCYSGGRFGLYDATTSTCALSVSSNGNLYTPGSIIAGTRFSAPLHTPASSSETCSTGDFYADANYAYVCTATNTLKRAALSGF